MTGHCGTCRAWARAAGRPDGYCGRLSTYPAAAPDAPATAWGVVAAAPHALQPGILLTAETFGCAAWEGVPAAEQAAAQRN
jgi:hypothetical protein